MNRLLSLAGALLIATAGVTVAQASPGSDAWVANSGAALQATVAEAGLAHEGKTVKIRVKLGASGPSAVRIVESSGSTDFDSAVKDAARKADLARPPSDLVGRTVTFTLGDQASGPSAAGAQ
ncbi:MAG: TonB family protein [Caulobacter sp.]|nr:TonB family protein [Caulobacter sp.]